MADGLGTLFVNPDPDGFREHIRTKKKGLFNKTMTVQEAIEQFVPDNTYIAIGGFGQTRIPVALLHEIIRRGRKNLGLSGHTATHDFQILAAGKSFNRCDVAYIIGLEMRGLSYYARKYCESDQVELTEWTNAALLWRYRAAAMGISFLPTSNMLGSDTYKYSAAKMITCPFTSKKYAAVPALSPDVALIHVHRADVYGNCQIDGSIIADSDLAAASKHVVVTCEKIIRNEDIRRQPDKTVIPYYMVDAVVEVPYGSYPGVMPYEYYSDEEHLAHWLSLERNEDEFQSFVDEQIRNTKDFYEYLQLNGGVERIRQLRQADLLIDREEKR